MAGLFGADETAETYPYLPLQDVLLARPRVSFPKAAAGGRLVAGSEKILSDSASSVHVSANGLQGSLSLEEQGRSSSTASLGR